MKKVYLMALAALFGSASMAQVSVTFQVDMNNETVSANGVHVAGSWQEEAGFSADWQPGESMMSDDDSDGIYELTVDVPAGEYQYKFINGNDWGPDETMIPGEVTIGGNRFFAVTDWHGDALNLPDGFMLPAVTFNGAAPAGQTAVRLNISMANETVSEDGVHVAGNLIDPNWTPAYGTASMAAPDEYSYVTYVDGPGTFQYKFLNGDTFDGPNESVPADCGTGSGDREIVVDAETVSTPFYCYGACEPCAEPNVTLTVDLSAAAVDNGGFVAGDFNGWSGAAMEDNGDGTYTIMLGLAPGTYAFKFQNGSGGWEDAIVGSVVCTNNDGNRVIEVVDGETLEYTACFGQCGETCITAAPANITFQVDMNAETVSPEGVWIIGGFTDFQTNAIQMTDDDSDGIYTTDAIAFEGSPFVAYKYVNGDVTVAENEESADFATLGCGIPNGIGGWNRIHTRSGEDEVLPVVPFNSCGPLSTNDIELGRVAIYPNPSDGVSFIEVENPNNHTLRMNIVDITGKTVTENMVINTNRYEINTTNLNSGLYFLNIVNERSETAVYKLMVK